MSMPPLRVVIVEDHALVRSAVRHALESSADLAVVGEAVTAEEAVGLIAECRPDVVLLDIDLPGMRGTELLRELAPRFPSTWIVMLTVSRAERDLIDSIRAGARGYLSKDLSPEALVRSIRAVRDGIMPMSRANASLLVSRFAAAMPRHQTLGVSALPELTVRENEVLGLLADGMTDREISVALVVSRRTVESHVRNILEKLGVASRLEAARIYRRRHEAPYVPR